MFFEFYDSVILIVVFKEKHLFFPLIGPKHVKWAKTHFTLLFMNFMNNLFSLWTYSPGEIVLKWRSVCIFFLEWT